MIKIKTSKKSRQGDVVEYSICIIEFNEIGIAEVEPKFAKALLNLDNTLSLVNPEDEDNLPEEFIPESKHDEAIKGIMDAEQVAVEWKKKYNELEEVAEIAASMNEKLEEENRKLKKELIKVEEGDCPKCKLHVETIEELRGELQTLRNNSIKIKDSKILKKDLEIKNLSELQEFAAKNNLKEEEWKSLTKKKLIEYIYAKC